LHRASVAKQRVELVGDILQRGILRPASQPVVPFDTAQQRRSCEVRAADVDHAHATGLGYQVRLGVEPNMITSLEDAQFDLPFLPGMQLLQLLDVKLEVEKFE